MALKFRSEAAMLPVRLDTGAVMIIIILLLLSDPTSLGPGGQRWIPDYQCVELQDCGPRNLTMQPEPLDRGFSWQYVAIPRGPR